VFLVFSLITRGGFHRFSFTEGKKEAGFQFFCLGGGGGRTILVVLKDRWKEGKKTQNFKEKRGKLPHSGRARLYGERRKLSPGEKGGGGRKTPPEKEKRETDLEYRVFLSLRGKRGTYREGERGFP